MIGDSIKLGVWNVEWSRAGTRRGITVSKSLGELRSDILCVTEGYVGLLPPAGHSVLSEADHGYQTTDDRRKVMLWSREPWSDIDSIGSPDLPSGRFVVGRTMTPIGPIRVVGVCIPWRDAHVRTGRRDRKPWQDHSDFISRLGMLLSQLDDSIPIIIFADFNQRVPRISQPLLVFDQLQAAFADRFIAATAGVLPGVNEPSIDHVALSRQLAASELQTFNGTSEDGQHLSDHFGLSLRLRLIKSIAPIMIRARMYAGLNDGTMNTGSLIEDERLKFILPQSCCYCGTRTRLSLDHLFAHKVRRC